MNLMPFWFAQGKAASAGAPTIVQSAYALISRSGGTGTLTLPAAATAGNLLVAAWCCLKEDTVSTGDAGFVNGPSYFYMLTGNHLGVQIQTKTATGGEKTFSVSDSNANGNIVMYELAGANTNTATWTLVGGGSTSSSSVITLPSLTPGFAAMMLCGITCYNLDAPVPPTVTGGWTIDGSDSMSGYYNIGAIMHLSNPTGAATTGALDNYYNSAWGGATIAIPHA